MMEIRRVDNNTYDVFQGRQWGTHTRVRKGRTNTYVLLGEKLPKGLLKFLHDILAPNMPVNYGQGLEVTLNNCATLAAMRK
jgi:hypothetical protein